MYPRATFAIKIVVATIIYGAALWGAFSTEHPRYFGESIQALGVREKNGQRLFAKVWTAADGIGRKFNERSCLACHSMPMPGGSGTTRNTFVPQDSSSTDLSGGHAQQMFERTYDGRITRLIISETASRRRTPALFGSGFIDAAIIPQGIAAGPDRILGRRGGSGKTPGRFGWKGRTVDLRTMNAAAFAVEIGLEGLLFNAGSFSDRAELAIDDVTSFLAGLDVPPRKLPLSEAARHGETIFSAVGCAQCHVPTLKIDPSSPISKFRQAVELYSDLLLHDMGEALSDGVSEGRAGPRDFRTPPLWGLTSTGPPYLHDGRATSIDEAITWHGGEAENTRERYLGLGELDRLSLMLFLESL